MSQNDSISHLEALARAIRVRCLRASTRAASGHPTSSLSATDLMTALLFGGVFRYDPDQPDHPNNDRLIFSKGHASPLFYALWAAAGRVSAAELDTYRQFGSPLEGHPTPRFPFAEAATGSLGQGLAIGLGMALNAKCLDRLNYRTYVLLGDSEMSEGSQWEAMQLASHYQLNNLIGIIDVNRLGQSGPTMLGHDLAAYARRAEAFGWEAITIDGHNLAEILAAYQRALAAKSKPVMIIARTIKGKGVSFLEDADHWHGKPLKEEQLQRALREFDGVDENAVGQIATPEDTRPRLAIPVIAEPLNYEPGAKIATRVAYGKALQRLCKAYPDLVALDAEVSNSTMSQTLKDTAPDRFFEMFIAEQAMVGAAQGLAARGKIPFVSTFAAFLTRAFDQIRMSQYSDANIKFVGSHAGVSIGEDGPSQMGLEDIAIFRALPSAVVLHPADAIATEHLVETAARHEGTVYLRTLRQPVPLLYPRDEPFPIGASKVLRQRDEDLATIVAAGATLHEALTAHATLAARGVAVRVIDAYCIQPIDRETLRAAADATGFIVTVEDHQPAGGLGEAVLSALADRPVPTRILAVRRRPMSGKPDELRAYEAISADAIVEAVERWLRERERSATTTRAGQERPTRSRTVAHPK
jgi:transketolase